MTKSKRTPDPAAVKRFAADLGRLVPKGAKLGIAVSGGPDSLALLLLASAARPGNIEAASVDHALRDGSRAEAEMVAGLCKELGIPHAILTAEWKRKPTTAIQERARAQRYGLLARWLADRGLDDLVTAHHLDDQAETFLMRLNRGAGARGLAGMRPLAIVPGARTRLVRPLLGWRRSELAKLCADAGVSPAEDPSNSDEQFERVRIRQALAETDWLDLPSVARSASHLAAADVALHWATDREWDEQVSRHGHDIVYRPRAPFELRRRIVRRAIAALAQEGRANPLRGRELDRLVGMLANGRTATLRGVLCSGGDEWRFAPAPARRRTN